MIVRRGIKTVVDLTEYEVVGSIGGMPIVVDPTMPKDEIRVGDVRLRIQAPE